MSSDGDTPSGGRGFRPLMGDDTAPATSLEPDTDDFARIKKVAYVTSIFGLLAVAFIAATVRTWLRVHRFRKLAVDDLFLILAVGFMTTSTIVVFATRHFTYTQLNVTTAMIMPPKDFTEHMLQFERMDNVATATVWAAIFSVKFSFIFFFRKLITKVDGVQVLWWVCVVSLCLAAPVCSFMGFYICGGFTEASLWQCTNAGMVRREWIYLVVTVCLDIVTDVLVISVPYYLLYRSNLNIKRKFALSGVLGLSVFMIIIAIVRVAFSNVSSVNLANAPPGQPRTVPDTVWLFFWQQLEASVAVLMVSLTAFRSMLGQQAPRRSMRAKAVPNTDGYASAGSRDPSLTRKSEKTASFFSKFRQPSQDSGTDTRNDDPTVAFATAAGPIRSVDRSIISYPVAQPGKMVPVTMTRLDQGPPPPPKSPRWRNKFAAQHRSWENRPEDVELKAAQPQTASFV